MGAHVKNKPAKKFDCPYCHRRVMTWAHVEECSRTNKLVKLIEFAAKKIKW